MFVDIVPNRNSPPAILLREGWREDGKVKKRTLANLAKWPQAKIHTLRRLLKNEPLVGRDEAFDIVRSRPHGHVAAVLGMLKKLRLDRLIAGSVSPQRQRVLTLIVARILDPDSRLATARGLAEATARDTLANTLGIGDTDENDLYAAMDWLVERQDGIERRLAGRHPGDGKVQIEFGLLCDAEGRPVAVEVFGGNTADSMTVGAQVDKLRQRFGIERVVLVGDRGMLTEARIREDVEPAGLDWISALRGPAVCKLVESGALQLSLFDKQDLVEIRSDACPGERLVVCRNPLLADERARKREELPRATEALLDPIVAAAAREKRPLTGRDRIALRVGKVVNKYKMARHFELDITDDAFSYRRKAESIAAEATVDGLYIVRTSVPASELDAAATVRACKRLSRVERALPTACRRTASPRCSATSPPLSATPPRPACPGPSGSRFSPDPPRYSARRSNCWACACNVPGSDTS